MIMTGYPPCSKDLIQRKSVEKKIIKLRKVGTAKNLKSLLP